jgi:hypothetical protein
MTRKKFSSGQLRPIRVISNRGDNSPYSANKNCGIPRWKGAVLVKFPSSWMIRLENSSCNVWLRQRVFLELPHRSEDAMVAPNPLSLHVSTRNTSRCLLRVRNERICSTSQSKWPSSSRLRFGKIDTKCSSWGVIKGVRKIWRFFSWLFPDARRSSQTCSNSSKRSKLHS